MNTEAHSPTVMKAARTLFGVFTLIVALFACSHAQCQCQCFLTNGLMAYYPFNGNANDASGRGHNGTVEGAVLTTNIFGQANSAYYFNGSALIDVPSSSDFDWLPSQGLTVSLWALPSVYLYPEHLLGRRNDAYPGFWQVAIGPGALNGLPIGQWTHLVLTIASNTVIYYTNGVTCQENPGLGTSPITNDVDLLIGGSAEYAEFVGNLTDIRIYNRILSTNEIIELYQNDSDIPPPPQVSLLQAVVPSFSCLAIGTNYQLQVSTDLMTWTNQGTPFTAASNVMNYSQYFVVSNSSQLYFRLQVTPP